MDTLTPRNVEAFGAFKEAQLRSVSVSVSCLVSQGRRAAVDVPGLEGGSWGCLASKAFLEQDLRDRLEQEAATLQLCVGKQHDPRLRRQVPVTQKSPKAPTVWGFF